MRPFMLPTAIALLTSVTLMTAACSNTGSSTDGVQIPDFDEEEGPPPEDIVSAVGTVRYVELEGGFYGLVADEDSTRYLPDSLGTEFREDGLRVRFRGVEENRASQQMWGTALKILKIRTLPDN